MLQCFLSPSIVLSLSPELNYGALSVKARFMQEVIEFNRRNKKYSQPEQMLKYRRIEFIYCFY